MFLPRVALEKDSYVSLFVMLVYIGGTHRGILIGEGIMQSNHGNRAKGKSRQRIIFLAHQIRIFVVFTDVR